MTDPFTLFNLSMLCALAFSAGLDEAATRSKVISVRITPVHHELPQRHNIKGP
jgi:hypothetical protein